MTPGPGGSELETLEVGPLRAAYRDTGSGEPVLLVHGSSATHPRIDPQGRARVSNHVRAHTRAGRLRGHCLSYASGPWRAYPSPAVAVVDVLAGALPSATVREIRGAGHMSPFTHREELRREVLEHLERPGA